VKRARSERAAASSSAYCASSIALARVQPRISA
jgi:hypothetical protein